jgi:hypothetical protein
MRLGPLRVVYVQPAPKSRFVVFGLSGRRSKAKTAEAEASRLKPGSVLAPIGQVQVFTKYFVALPNNFQLFPARQVGATLFFGTAQSTGGYLLGIQIRRQDTNPGQRKNTLLHLVVFQKPLF